MNSLRRNRLFLKAALTGKVPVYVQYAVTKRCNLNCRMCRTTASRQEEVELTLEEISKIADILSEIGIGILILTGGEPMLKDDLAKIVGIFTERGIKVRLQTNAIPATGDKVAELVSAGLKEVTVSLNSLHPEVNDRITGLKGSWHRIMRGLANFSEGLPEKGNLCGVNITVSSYNLGELPALIKFVTYIGFFASLIPVHLANGKDENQFIVRASAPDCGFQLQDHQLIDEIYDRVIQMKKGDYRIYNSFRFLRESREFLKTGKINWTCQSPDLYFSISPQGYFLPCVDIKTEESMLEGNFLKRYRSGELRVKIRESVRACRGCMYACYPEIVYVCRHPRTFLERVGFALKVRKIERKKLTYDELINAAEKFRGSECDK